MKSTKLFIFSLMLGVACFGQNITMAKAFYEKAQKTFENQDYEQTKKLLNSAKKELNNNTNPDIIYLEAYSLYHTELNVNEAKELFNSFLEQVDEHDDRRNEVANTMVIIQSSENYHNNGNVKAVFQICDKDYLCMTQYNENLEIEKVIKKRKPSDFENRKAFYSKDELGFLFFSLSGKDLTEVSYCKNEILISRKSGNKYYLEDLYYKGNIYIQRKIIEQLKQDKVLPIKYCEGNYFVAKADIKLAYTKIFNPLTKKLVFYYDQESFSSYQDNDSSGGESKYFYHKGEYEILGFYKIPYGILNSIGNKIGAPKEVKFISKTYNNDLKDYTIISFEIEGIPIKKEFYKKGKLKEVNNFDKDSETWIKQ
tara:strand:+ start:262 stop:1365 length:1104 start_codon:yes stop_codon:yes gene_type:complete